MDQKTQKISIPLEKELDGKRKSFVDGKES